MENKRFVIECRYESFTREGKKFINWFVYDGVARTEDNAKNRIREIKKEFGYIDQKTKLKHEYRLKPYAEYELERDSTILLANESARKYKEYLNSPEHKELQKKKRQAIKERKERQKKYIEEHTKNET